MDKYECSTYLLWSDNKIQESHQKRTSQNYTETIKYVLTTQI